MLCSLCRCRFNGHRIVHKKRRHSFFEHDGRLLTYQRKFGICFGRHSAGFAAFRSFCRSAFGRRQRGRLNFGRRGIFSRKPNIRFILIRNRRSLHIDRLFCSRPPVSFLIFCFCIGILCGNRSGAAAANKGAYCARNKNAYTVFFHGTLSKIRLISKSFESLSCSSSLPSGGVNHFAPSSCVQYGTSALAYM